jgi:protein phosphatase
VFGVDQENSESEKYGAPTQGAVVCFCPPDPWAREPLLELPSKVVLESWLRTKGAPWDLPCVPATIPPPSGSIMRSLREESADHPAHQLLEHPEAAFRYYESVGVDRVVVEYKYMGSRMIASSQDGKEWKFHSRAGMRFFRPEQEAEFLERAKPTLDTLVQRYGTPILLDGELMPWSLKARGLIEDTFGPVAALASHAEKHRPDLYEERRLKHLVAYRNQLNIFGASSEVHYRVWNVRTPALDKARKSLMIGDPDRTFREELACLLGDEGAIRGISDYTVWLDQPFGRKLVARSFVEGRFLLSAAPDLEGFVVKPMPSMRQRRSTAEADLKVMQGLETNSIAPAIKVRRPEYLRLIYGPEYPDYLGRLQNRSVGRKMAQASNETRMAEKALKAWYEGDRYACAEACLRLHSLDDGSLDPRL